MIRTLISIPAGVSRMNLVAVHLAQPLVSVFGICFLLVQAISWVMLYLPILPEDLKHTLRERQGY